MKWIKCSDRLPNPGSCVIIYNGFIGTGCYVNKWYLDMLDDDDEVTHWMPFPKPPEEP